MSADASAERGLGWGFPVLVASFLGAIAGLILARHFGRPELGERARPPVHDAPEIVPGWSASAPMPDGGRLEVRLARMHADPERERFEAMVLERRLGLPPGEPWRLQLAWRRAPSAEGSSSVASVTSGAGGTNGDGGTTGVAATKGHGGTNGKGATESGDSAALASAPVALDALRVIDAGGEALLPITSARARADGAPADPVAVLFQPPDEGLLPEHEVSLILWGRAPEGAATLRGSFPAEPEIALAETGLVAAELTRSLVVARSPATSYATGD